MVLVVCCRQRDRKQRHSQSCWRTSKAIRMKLMVIIINYKKSAFAYFFRANFWLNVENAGIEIRDALSLSISSGVPVQRSECEFIHNLVHSRCKKLLYITKNRLGCMTRTVDIKRPFFSPRRNGRRQQKLILLRIRCGHLMAQCQTREKFFAVIVFMDGIKQLRWDSMFSSCHQHFPNDGSHSISWIFALYRRSDTPAA